MIKIADRGSFEGRHPALENSPQYIEHAIASGYNVKVDVWLIDGVWMLGHDFPMHKIDRSFLERESIWVHAKNLIGYVSLYNNPRAHVFWHNLDDFAITSKGIKWAKEGVITYDGVMTAPSNNTDFIQVIKEGAIDPLGICSDNFTLFSN